MKYKKQHNKIQIWHFLMSKDNCHVAFFLICLFILCINETIKIQNHFIALGNNNLSILEYWFLILYNGAYMPYAATAYLLLVGEIKRTRINDVSQRKTKAYFFDEIILCGSYSFMATIAFATFAILFALMFGRTDMNWTILTTPIAPTIIVKSMTPLTASLLSLYIIFLFWFETGLFLNMMYKMKAIYLGLMIFIVAIHWDSIWFEETPDWAPAQCFTLKAILSNADIGKEGISLKNGIVFLLIGIIIFGAIICLENEVIKRKSSRKL